MLPYYSLFGKTRFSLSLFIFLSFSPRPCAILPAHFLQYYPKPKSRDQPASLSLWCRHSPGLHLKGRWKTSGRNNSASPRGLGPRCPHCSSASLTSECTWSGKHGKREAQLCDTKKALWFFPSVSWRLRTGDAWKELVHPSPPGRTPPEGAGQTGAHPGSRQRTNKTMEISQSRLYVRLSV